MLQHLAIIPDGNRRWAKQNKLKTILGHKSGMEAFKRTIKFCMEKGIKYLSFYTFSLENFNRPEEEKNYLFSMLAEQASSQLNEFVEKQIRVRFIGDRSFFPEHLKPVIEKLEDATKSFDRLNLNLLFCYGGRREIVLAVKDIALKFKSGDLDINNITEESFFNYLWTTGIPDPELVIRTSNRARLSNFLLYQAAYSELMFLDIFWPDITDLHLQKCLADFENIERNFGK
ncbi:MAG: Ditrans,polycis-undecaprenyl-diphosphate synthase ((2E,6E)-farnesyl-diphosphate specific) [candidate division TM6 bacterium GW2011_GWF2_28_16]|jgi:undecaprenyl diphosphate synthase|nr:MAG: Ditrans,polycis-undecaprenyl-diphosphate synthase ((2E,6E)-farnesyl-diphosphate specific) [candidate division TM6 bacterium GW2011_GWF2_28_16]